MHWVPIRYGEFYDIPRLFLAEHAGAVYVFDCPFDEAADNYPERYQVYRLPSEILSKVGASSWEDLVHAGSYVGEVPLEAVRFDATRRAGIDDSVFDEL